MGNKTLWVLATALADGPIGSILYWSQEISEQAKRQSREVAAWSDRAEALEAELATWSSAVLEVDECKVKLTPGSERPMFRAIVEFEVNTDESGSPMSVELLPELTRPHRLYHFLC